MKIITLLAAATGLSLLFSGWTSGAGRGTQQAMAAWLGRMGGSGPHAVRPAAVSLVLGVGATSLLLAATGLAVPAVLAGATVATVPLARRQGARRRRRELVGEAWPDALSSVIAGIRAGMSLPECCCALSERGPAALQPAFAAFAATYRACGGFAAGLQRLRDELEDPMADRIAVVLGLADEVGGTDLVRILRASSDFVRDDLRTRGEVRARWSWTVNAARLAAATPLAVLIVMSLRPEARSAYSTPAGAMTIAIGALVTLVGYRLMLRAGRLPEDRRLA